MFSSMESDEKKGLKNGGSHFMILQKSFLNKFFTRLAKKSKFPIYNNYLRYCAVKKSEEPGTVPEHSWKVTAIKAMQCHYYQR